MVFLDIKGFEEHHLLKPYNNKFGVRLAMGVKKQLKNILMRLKDGVGKEIPSYN